MKQLRKLTAILLVVLLVLSSFSGCGKDKDNEDTPAADSEGAVTQGANNSDAIKDLAAQFPKVSVSDNPVIEGGVLNYALSSDSAIGGILNPVVYDDNYDSEVLAWMSESIVSFDEDFVMDQDGAATYEYDVEAKTITLHMKEGVKWHDGELVTLDDLVFAYEVICDKDYQGFRYDESFINVIGAEEYHNGTADTISGLELSEDEMTLVMHFKDFYPSILVGGIWSSAIPRHYYGDVAVADLVASEKSRIKPIGFGPFKIKNVVPGEAYEFERFDDYWRGRPKLDGVIITVVKPELIPTAMKEGKYDYAEFSSQQYPDYKDPANYQYLGQVETVFSYTGFKLGKWDAEKNENIVDPNAKMANLKLRQAIGYAADSKTLGETFYNGLRFLATTVITPRHATYQNKELEGYVYDPEKAKELLDEAGYKDVDGDGFREDPKGEPFTITWAVMDGENMDTYVQFKSQCLADVGLAVELYNGRLTEFNAFYEAVEADDPAIDMYDAAWSTGFDPNPASLWGPSSPANYTRYTSDTFKAIINAISSKEAWDSDFLTEKYHAWQQAFFDEAPAIPTLWRTTLYSVNNRVKNFDLISSDIKATYHLIELTAEEPIK